MDSGQPFRDPEFGPSPSDPKGMKSIILEPPFGGAPEEDEVHWTRIGEIAPKGEKAMFIKSGATSCDVI